MLAAGRPRIWLEKVPAPGSRATEVFPTHPPAAALPSGGFLGKRRGSSGSAHLVAQAWLPIAFNTTRASYLRVASPGFPPTPSPAQPSPAQPSPAQPSPAEAEPRAFEVRRISIQEEPAGPKPAAPAGEGTAGPRRGGRVLPTKGGEKRWGPGLDPSQAAINSSLLLWGCPGLLRIYPSFPEE